MVNVLTIKEAVELASNEKFKWLSEFLSVFPNFFGINLCAVESITFECEDDEYGQLTDMHVKFIPAHNKEDYEVIKANGGPWPWLVKDENGEVVLRG